VTGQIPDEVRYRGERYAITAVEGMGLFDPADHGVTPGPLGTGCWRGFQCRYRIRQGRLLLYDVHIGRPEDGDTPRPLFGVRAVHAGRYFLFSDGLVYRFLKAPVPFSGRLLLCAGYMHVGYLHMGFNPAWLYSRVHEISFEAGRVTSRHDRSAALAAARDRLGQDGLRPAPGEPGRDWIDRTFSLSFDYSWPS